MGASMHMLSARSVGLLVATVAIVATSPPVLAGSAARTAAGIGVGAVLGAIILDQAARAAPRPTAPRATRAQSKPAANDAKTDGKSAVHQIDERSTAANATEASGKPASNSDPFANTQAVKQTPSGQ